MKSIGVLIVVTFFLLVFVSAASNNEAIAGEPHMVVFTDGTAIYAVDSNNPGRIIRLTAPLLGLDRYIDHPYVAGTKLWYDQTEKNGTGGQRLTTSKWMGGYSTAQKTRDPWGDSSDTTPVVSSLGAGVIFTSDRTGVTAMEYDSDGTLGPGYGRTIFDEGAACWGLTSTDKNIAYLAPYMEIEVPVSDGVEAIMYGSNGVFAWDHRKATKTAPMIPFSADKSLIIDVDRLSVTIDQHFLISGDWSLYYLIPGQDAKLLAPEYVSEGIISPDGTKVLYVVDSDDNEGQIVVSAEIDQAGELTNTQNVVQIPNLDIQSETISPTWAPDEMFVSCKNVSVKLNFAKPGNDSVSLSGSLIVPEGTSYDTATMTLGDFSHTFYLNQKENKFHLSSAAPVVGVPKVRSWSVTAKGDFAAALATAGFTNANVKSKPVLDLKLTFSGNSVSDTYTLTMPLKYTAHAGKSGSITD
jgi:hypothetical protein